MVDHDSGKRKGDFGDFCWRDFRSRRPFTVWGFFVDPFCGWDVAKKTFVVFLFHDLFIFFNFFNLFVYFMILIYLFICVFFMIYWLLFVLFLIYLLIQFPYTRKSKWQFAPILRIPKSLGTVWEWPTSHLPPQPFRKGPPWEMISGDGCGICHWVHRSFRGSWEGAVGVGHTQHRRAQHLQLLERKLGTGSYAFGK